ncbi:MAG: hypothetical protein WCH99_22210 [Verrucomicrobiota bacterium]
MKTNSPLLRELQKCFSINSFVAILVLFASFTNTLHADYSPKECYERIGNPQVDLSDQGAAFSSLTEGAAGYAETWSAGDTNRIEAAYYLAECYVSGKTGDGGPDFLRNQKGFPPNQPEAYKLAIPLYEKAAYYDYLPALVRLSAIFADEKYSGKDADKSLTYLIRAAKLGDANSFQNLLPLYSAGFPGVTDERQKFMGMELLADNGVPEAQVELSKWLIAKNSYKAFDEAKQFLTPLADKGNSSAVALLQEIEDKVNAAHLKEQKAAADEASQKELAKKQGIASQRSEKLANVLVTSVICLIAFIGLAGLKLIWTGIDWGMKDKAVVYNGKSDLVMSCVISMTLFVAAVLICFGEDMAEGGWALAVLSVFLLVYSARKSYVANLNSIQKTLVVVPTKIFLSSLIVFAGLFSIGGIKSGIESSTKASRVYGYSAKERKERAKHKADAAASFMAAAFAAAAFYKLQKLAQKLVKENSTPT